VTLKDCLWRELRYGSVLGGNVAASHIKMDVRLEPDSAQPESDYPWLIFSVVGEEYDEAIGLAKATVEFMLIGKMSGATKNDDLLETIKDLLIAEFGGHCKTWGKYTSAGVADPTGGLKMRGAFLEGAEAFDEALDEKVHTLTFRFAYLR